MPESLPLALILDDRPSRHRLISAELQGRFRLWHVYDPDEAISALCDPENQFAFVSLDHYLGHPILDGLDVVQAVTALCANGQERDRLRKARWRVHSLDPQAGREMVRLLEVSIGKDAVDGYVPLP